ncbi:uncharacterized protein [Chanodichthys erythropterus]|uniref:uncharacterized protein n=1 Tax=Chanodichthys erythropterus TaxID=933992 RepID=UPI00351DF70E
MIPDPEGHPVTGSAEHYALYDRFHEDNTKDPRDVLRKLRTVPQLAGKVNSQVAEQLFSRMKKNNYFLNMALPSTHLFLMRNIIHHHNTYRNEQRLGNIKKAFGNDVTMNRHSQAVLVNPVSPEKVSTVPMGIDVPTVSAEPVPKTASLDTPKAAPKTVPMPSFLAAPKPAPFGFSKLSQLCSGHETAWSRNYYKRRAHMSHP